MADSTTRSGRTPRKAPARPKRAKSPAKGTKASVARATARSPKSADGARRILMTGFPGFIGRRIASRLLDMVSGVEIRFLVQEKFAGLAETMVSELGARVRGADKRLSVVRGDITKEDIGLGPDDKARVLADTTEVWHLAAIYDLTIDETAAWNVNVEGTRRVLDLCEQIGGFKRLVHFSTCYVSGSRTGTVFEDDLEMGQSFKNHYESTKFKSEVLVRERMGRVPAVIIRPAIVIGDSETGETDKYDGPYPVIRLLALLEQRPGLPKGLRVPAMGGGAARLNLVPVDYVVKAACRISGLPDATGKTYQISDPNPLSMPELFGEIYGQFGLGAPLGAIPPRLMDMVLRIPGAEASLGFSRQSLPYMDQPVYYDCRNTLAAIQGTEIRPPELRRYLPTIVDYVRRHMRGKRKAMY